MKRAGLLLASLLQASAVLGAPLRLTIEEYVDLSIKQGLSDAVSRANEQAALFARRATVRDFRAPKLSALAVAQSDYSRTSIDVVRVDSVGPGLGLQLPLFPTGGTFTANATLAQARTRERAASGETLTYARETPRATLTLSQPLYVFIGDPRRRADERSRLSFLQSQDVRLRDRLAIRASARAFYYEVLIAKEQLAAQEARLASSRLVHDATTSLVKAGRAAAVDGVRTELRLRLAERRRENARQALRTALNNARNFARLAPGAELEFVSRLPFLPVEPAVERLVEFALAHNPDVDVAAKTAENAALTVAQARDQRWPQVNLNGTYAYRQITQFGPFLQDRPVTWTASATVSWLVFDWRKSASDVRSAKYSLESANLALEQARLKVANDVLNAYQDAKRVELQLPGFDRILEQAREALAITRLRYRNGLTRVLDVFDAEDQLFNLQLERIDLLVRLHRDRDALSQHLGRTLEDLLE